jgi:hypothetical protein
MLTPHDKVLIELALARELQTLKARVELLDAIKAHAPGAAEVIDVDRARVADLGELIGKVRALPTWIEAAEGTPTHINGVLGRVVGGPLHFDEQDYTAVVYYINGRWVESSCVDQEPGDIEIEVSKWIELPE